MSANAIFTDLFRPEDSTALGAARANCKGRSALTTRTFATAKVLLWTCMSFMLSVGISQLQ
ncbi:hypothetical protein [Salidesulfovibrio onnuriiensis]|uniref:hypothetical protein n=1 Tax=Salidesulfovibrio onnuriiensis TaxID=2583823 RepID=UPI0011CBDEFE|nr:hypothetical protein [Salidesulfovibrio onnuriiensis]